LEEPLSSFHIKLAIRFSSIHEERDGKGSFCIGRKETRGGKRKVGVRCNGLLDSMETEFGGNREIVETSTELITE